MTHSSKTYLLVGLVIIALAGIGAYAFREQPVTTITETKGVTEFALPVPFTTQAPDNNWDHNENCEEASIVMANAYLTGNSSTTLDPAQVHEAITNIKKWEQENLGHVDDTGAAETARMIEAVYNRKTKLIDNFTEEDLKRELQEGHVVLLPINAQGLAHPNYRQGETIYHMVVIRGFNTQGFIVHDPGTEAGQDNIYAYDKLFVPAADWDSENKKLLPEKKTVVAVW